MQQFVFGEARACIREHRFIVLAGSKVTVWDQIHYRMELCNAPEGTGKTRETAMVNRTNMVYSRQTLHFHLQAQQHLLLVVNQLAGQPVGWKYQVVPLFEKF